MSTSSKMKIVSLALAITLLVACVFCTGCEEEETIDLARISEIYNEADALMKAGHYKDAADFYETIIGYCDSYGMYQQCTLMYKAELYEEAMELYDQDKFEEAYAILGPLDYGDSAILARSIIDIMPELLSVGDVIVFGTYEQDNDLGTEKELIEWIVLDIQDGKAMMISKYALDAQFYHNNRREIVTWENCTLRLWLNSYFYNTAFSQEEKMKVCYELVKATANTEGGEVNPGKDTYDNVFILSVEEAEKYFKSDLARKCQATAFAKDQNAYTATSDYCWWRLRTPGTKAGRYADVNSDGSIFYMGLGATTTADAIRPAIWVKFQ